MAYENVQVRQLEKLQPSSTELQQSAARLDFKKKKASLKFVFLFSDHPSDAIRCFMQSLCRMMLQRQPWFALRYTSV